MATQLRELLPEEMASTDAIYDSVRLSHSDPACTRMAAAFDEQTLVGIGRLIDLGDSDGRRVLELGGMWVHSEHRRRGLASRIIDRLQSWAPPGMEIWCTPFADLMPLYGKHGFVQVIEEQAPPPVVGRLSLCASSQERDVFITKLVRQSH